MALLEARGLSLQLPDRSASPAFGTARVASIFRDIDLIVAPGESVGIVGESGSGKTSLARTLLRLYQPTSGSLHFHGRDITHMPESGLRQGPDCAQRSLGSLWLRPPLERGAIRAGRERNQRSLRAIYSNRERVASVGTKAVDTAIKMRHT